MPDRRSLQLPQFETGVFSDRRFRIPDRRRHTGAFRILHIRVASLWTRFLMKPSGSASRIVWFETAAFGTLIAMSWANEFGLEKTLFGAAYVPNWRDAALQTAITVLVGVPTVLLSWRLSRRLHYLEGFLRVCSWCRKVGDGDTWISLEEYLETNLHTKTTHGICQSCSSRLKGKAREPDIASYP